mmetsp:Transcript_13616/g.18632  ORF Transcript_13616/g.18632 Transcript_13616/m.18632 type:complete len:120 (-) Transcript_13616:107-466(-)
MSIERKKGLFGGESGRQWKIFTVEALTPRQNPTVAPLNDSHFLIMGGYHEERFVSGDSAGGGEDCSFAYHSVDYLSDAIIVDGFQKSAVKVIDKTDFRFQCWSPSVLVADGTVITLVRD